MTGATVGGTKSPAQASLPHSGDLTGEIFGFVGGIGGDAIQEKGILAEIV